MFFELNPFLILLNIFICILIAWDVRQWYIHEKILNGGIKDCGRLISITKYLYIGYVIPILNYNLRIEFVHRDDKYELLAHGRFHRKLTKVGETITIYYSEQYPDKVVIAEPSYKYKYILKIIVDLAVFFYVLSLH